MKKKIMIEGMSCGHCVKHVEEALGELNAVSTVEVNLEGKYAVIEGAAEDTAIKEAIDEAGYDVVSIENI